MPEETIAYFETIYRITCAVWMWDDVEIFDVLLSRFVCILFALLYGLDFGGKYLEKGAGSLPAHFSPTDYWKESYATFFC